MKKLSVSLSLRAHAVALGGCVALLLAAVPASAQAVYRIVAPDGKVTFSDKPPVANAGAPASGVAGKTPELAAAVLPLELRQAVNKYPVVLYTASNCAPCGSGRALLSRRGVPFTEKTVNTAEDADALQRISGGNSLPFLTIGGQHIKGYSDSEWTQFLDAAGYPKTSVLPSTYRSVSATPLVALQKPAPADKPDTAAPDAPAAPSAAPTASPSNPAGIRF